MGFTVAIPNLLGLNATWYEIFTEHKLEIKDIKKLPSENKRIDEVNRLLGTSIGVEVNNDLSC